MNWTGDTYIPLVTFNYRSVAFSLLDMVIKYACDGYYEGIQRQDMEVDGVGRMVVSGWWCLPWSGAPGCMS